ncbi:hypothetical protein P7C70_g7581, partial [Phenoliferia sp. Uapishka_3]
MVYILTFVSIATGLLASVHAAPTAEPSSGLIARSRTGCGSSKAIQVLEANLTTMENACLAVYAPNGSADQGSVGYNYCHQIYADQTQDALADLLNATQCPTGGAFEACCVRAVKTYKPTAKMSA